ncbi:unnamed protein product, partial [Iphiclides podalirius]
MSIKKLEKEVQSGLIAATKIKNYERAIEELVYNSLDSGSSSIAIRINIHDSFIQVIDNGSGISKSDINLLGQRYATSKAVDASLHKSVPNKYYGFRGESLANIIQISKNVKIITRYEKSKGTWIKCFYKGQHKNSYLIGMRPSKGTTVEIKGFLYNSHIQTKEINNFAELQSIKNDLEGINKAMEVPYYFIFISCPQHDYDISFNPEMTIVQFKDWNQIKLLIDKFVKFYNGDIKLTEVKTTKQPKEKRVGTTQEEVRRIFENILGNKNKTQMISQMQKGVKGKTIRKKVEKKVLHDVQNKKCPKRGMSPIFENCNSKKVCSYDLEMDYFKDDLYDEFANNVLDNFELFDTMIKNVNDNVSENFVHLNSKFKKDITCLKFNRHSLTDAKVFGQIDKKYIVAELHSESNNMLKYLVLFDQHAVHERIKLEENLSDYIKDDRWISIDCETLSINLTKENVIYLSNFKDKFAQLGLKWTYENDFVMFNAIPKAILGKHCRQPDVVLRCVKHLIIEEIKAIKYLRGNSLLYPKSMMDLVFSEACRYAIKFGDSLSKDNCRMLITSLSTCKTPFQCAHGRPVMAVLMDMRAVDNEYTVLL